MVSIKEWSSDIILIIFKESFIIIKCEGGESSNWFPFFISLLL
jgi:hypothetical protein